MTPKYLQILHALSTRIDAMKPGDPLPSEEELSREYDASPMTTRRALTILIDAKRIIGIRGKGTFVARQPMTRSMELNSFSDTMRSLGRAAHSRVLEVSMGPAGNEAAAELGLTPDEQVYRIRRLRFGDDVPIGIDHSVLPADRFPGLLGHQFTGSLYALLREHFGVGIERATSRIRAIIPDDDSLDLLELPPGTPCLAVHALAHDEENVVVESTRSLYRGDLYELKVDHTRSVGMKEPRR